MNRPDKRCRVTGAMWVKAGLRITSYPVFYFLKFQLAQLLPMEENFLLLFRFDNPLESSVEFMRLWHTYDSDNSGYIEADELKVIFKQASNFESSPRAIFSEESIAVQYV